MIRTITRKAYRFATSSVVCSLATVAMATLLFTASSAHATLVSHWALDESSGTTAFDSQGLNDAPYVGTPTQVSPGVIGAGALEMDAEGDRAAAPDSASLDVSTGMTFSAWLKRTRTGEREIFTGKADGSGPGTSSFWLEITSGNGVRFLMGNGTVDRVVAGSSITDTEWHQVVGTWDGTTQRLFLDGGSIGTPLAWSGTIFNSDDPLVIGQIGTLSSLALIGTMDDVALWDEGLTTPEIIATNSAALFEALNYNAEDVDRLFTIHDNTGSTTDTINGRFWVYADDLGGLGLSPGIVTEIDGSLFLLLGSGTGVVNLRPIPEPSSFLLLGLGVVGLAARGRRRSRIASRPNDSELSTDPSSKTMKTRAIDFQNGICPLVIVLALAALLIIHHPAHAATLGQSASTPGISAKHILDQGASQGDGIYWIDPDGPGGNAPFQAYADMTTDDGGWTLVGFAGNIPTTKTALAGANNWFMIFNNFGTYDPNALTTNTAFSRRDQVDGLFQDTSEILTYRTSNTNNQMIFPVADRTSWLSGILPEISYLTLTNDGSNYVTHPGSELAVYNQGTLPRYTGYDWNLFNNSDNQGSYATGLNHRSLIYWENLDNATYDQQWFHAQPLSLVPSTGPINNFQDIAFFLREDVDYPVIPEPSTWTLLGLGALGLVRRARRRRRVDSSAIAEAIR